MITISMLYVCKESVIVFMCDLQIIFHYTIHGYKDIPVELIKCYI